MSSPSEEGGENSEQLLPPPKRGPHSPPMPPPTRLRGLNVRIREPILTIIIQLSEKRQRNLKFNNYGKILLEISN
jgi:hypothetical protein